MEHAFLCPTKNPNPKVSVVNVILLPLGTTSHQHQYSPYAIALLTIKHISLHRMDLPSRLITDIKFPIDNDLDLVVCILVDQRRALLQSIKASRYRSCWVVGLGGRNITKVGVLVGDQRRFEGGLGIAVVGECWGRHFCGGFFGSRGLRRFDFTEEGAHC
jgi:hypothetical protein